MADDTDSRTASVGRKRALREDYNDASVKQARVDPGDDYMALDSSAESGEILSEDEEENIAETSPEPGHDEASVQQPVYPTPDQLDQIQALQERALGRLTIYGPTGGSDVTPKESKLTTKLKKMKNRVLAISVIAPNAHHTYGPDHTARLTDALLHWIGRHPVLLSRTIGLLMLTPDAWKTLRPNAHKCHLLLRMRGVEDIEELLPTMTYSECPIPGAQAVLLDAFKVNTMPSSADLSKVYRLTWADKTLQEIAKGCVQRVIDNLRLGKITLQECLTDDSASAASNAPRSSAASSAHISAASSSYEGETRNSEAGAAPPPPPPPRHDSQQTHGEAPPLPQGPPPVLLSDLSPDLQALQRRYWPHISGDSLAICEVCSIPGHISASCPSRICAHCSTDISSRTGHFSSACPKVAHCKRCKAQGHVTAACTSKLAAAADESSAVPCDNCLLPGHELHECEWLWRTYTPILPVLDYAIPAQLEIGIPISRRNAHPPPKTKLLRQCYNCAKDSHLGDDCPSLPGRDDRKQKFGLFSAEWSNLFASNPYTPPPPRPASGGSIPQQNSHIIFTEDSEDDDESMDISDDSHFDRTAPAGSSSAPSKRPKRAKPKQEPAYSFQHNNSDQQGPKKPYGHDRNRKQDIKFSSAPGSFMAQTHGQSHRGMHATGLPPRPPPRRDDNNPLESRITGGGGRGRGRGNRSRGGRGGGYNSVPPPRNMY